MNPLKKVTFGITSLCLLFGAVLVYKKFTKDKPAIMSAQSSVKKKVTKRKIPQSNGAAPIEEEIIEDEKLDSFLSAQLAQPKNHLLGLTLSYDEGIKYNIIFGKRITGDLYGVGKVTTDFNFSRAEVGIIYVF